MKCSLESDNSRFALFMKKLRENYGKNPLSGGRDNLLADDKYHPRKKIVGAIRPYLPY
jgi:hypothetical protein